MSLLHPTPGEMFDRWSLLGIKIAKGEEAGKDVSHFQEEEKEIRKVLFSSLAVTAKCMIEMQNVQLEMWDLIAKAEAGVEVSAIHLQKLNRDRIAIREYIDRETGHFKGPERV